MFRRRARNSEERKLQFEQFEQRLVMSAQAVTSLLPELEIASPALTQQVVSLDHAAGDAAAIANQYGLDGAGQTVAVIDSGIAWDHYALGGGFGAGHKVVGGWDFAENDADPYDDGPAGFHGSHVAGIIGSTDDQIPGVSSGVDLVALRVFGDNGEGHLDWVEQALQWVHEHKDDFANPITTVNLSLGTHWDPESTPDWANLDDEFAKLKSDGIFISVAAGNGFRSLGDVGLSYPAVNSNVVPVASHNADGQLSDFSQRDDRVLVAPGELLRSTVPDHLFGGQTGQFLGSTGTSMAAPYVAGASAILRQANEFMGVENIDQDLLYRQFRETANQIHDSVTGGYYYKINLEAALASVIKDYHSDSIATASNAGVLRGGEVMRGTIGQQNDVDRFQFTADRSGRMTFQFEITDDLMPLVDVIGSSARIQDNQISFDVVAGQKYDFSVATADGTGHYKIIVDLVDHDAATDLGRVIAHEFSNLAVSGESLFQLSAIRNGFLTVETTDEHPSGRSFAIEIYDRGMNLIQSAQSSTGQLRLDVQARAGEAFFLKAIGNSEAVNIRAFNLVSLDAGSLTINGTHQRDDIVIHAQNQFSVSVNGLDYQFALTDVNNIHIEGYKSYDSINVVLGESNDRVNTRVDGVSINNQNFSLNSNSLENVNVVGGGGYDVASLNDSEGNDRLSSGSSTAGRRWVTLSGQGFRSQVSGFDVAYVRGSDGFDQASISGTVGDDVFASRGERNILRVNGATVLFDLFDSIEVSGLGGRDAANLHDSAGVDRFVLSPQNGSISNDSYVVSVTDFTRINAFSNEGRDTVEMHDSAGSDHFVHRDGIGVLNGEGFLNFAQGFSRVEAYSAGGRDAAQIFDTGGNDYFVLDANGSRMSSANLHVSARGFHSTSVFAHQGGFDRALVFGTSGDDFADAGHNRLQVNLSNGIRNQIAGAEEIQLNLLGGNDSAFLLGSSDREILQARFDEIEFQSTLQMLRMTNAENIRFNGNGGFDQVVFDELGELDLLESLGDKATVFMQNHTVTAEDFALLEASTVDHAIAEYDLEEADFLYMLRGQWAQKR